MDRKQARWGAAVAASLTIAGCASYTPAPLEQRAPLPISASSLAGASGKAVTLAELDRLIVCNNPDLMAARSRLGVADAQIVAAGILPNPQMAASYPFYISGPDGSDGFGLSVAQDLKSIILRPVKREVAGNASAQIGASLLWQEWQTIGKARLLYVDIVVGEQAASVIAKSRRLLKQRFDLTRRSLDQGNAPLASLSPDLVALGDIQKTDDELARTQLVRRHQLNALLGLAPDAPLRLAETPAVPRLDAGRVRADLASISDRRPDLVALQYGYRSQDARLRQSVIAQFPNLAVGVFGGRDTSAIYSVGPQATFELPLFDRNEGNIAIERATRDELHHEFAARVTTATGEIEALLSEQALLRRQFDALGPRLREARTIAEKTEAAFRQGDFDERSYVDVEVSLLAQEQEKLSLERALLEGQVELATLTGAGMPRVRIEAEPPPADPLGLLRAVSR